MNILFIATYYYNEWVKSVLINKLTVYKILNSYWYPTAMGELKSEPDNESKRAKHEWLYIAM